MHAAKVAWKIVGSTTFMTALACISSSDFDAKLETFQAQIDVMESQAQRCAQDLRAIGGSEPMVAGRLPGHVGLPLVGTGWRISEPISKEVTRRQHEIDGARMMIARAAAIGPGALEQVVTSLARAHYAYAELCRERDEVATITALAGMHGAANAGIGQLDR